MIYKTLFHVNCLVSGVYFVLMSTEKSINAKKLFCVDNSGIMQSLKKKSDLVIFTGV